MRLTVPPSLHPLRGIGRTHWLPAEAGHALEVLDLAIEAGRILDELGPTGRRSIARSILSRDPRRSQRLRTFLEALLKVDRLLDIDTSYIRRGGGCPTRRETSHPFAPFPFTSHPLQRPSAVARRSSHVSFAVARAFRPTGRLDDSNGGSAGVPTPRVRRCRRHDVGLQNNGLDHSRRHFKPRVSADS